MSLLSVRKVEIEDISVQLIEKLSKVLAYTEPENYREYFEWWEEWFSDKIPGNKITIIAEEQDEIVGVMRLWKTPYCSNKWLIEGLEVIPPRRRAGIGKAIVEEGISVLLNTYDDKLYVHIANNNIPSIKLHESLGFIKITSGSVNSYGEFREHLDEYLLICE